MQTFVTQQWKNQTKEKLNCPHSKKLNDKKVKSPLHIFSTLRRSPSYPPPGCIKSKKKLKPEQDGVSKSHRLLRRSCSGAVKQQAEVDGLSPGPGKSAHKLLGHPLPGSLRMEPAHSGPLKSHRLLGRGPCPAAIKPEDCPAGLRLAPGKLFPRSCSGDPHWGGGLKAQRLLSRSCSGSMKTEELDGLKHHHRLLSRSYSSSTKMGRADIFKDSVPEVRRLSLTSGLIGILAPSLPNNGAKLVPIGDKGFLVQIMEYAEQRIPVLNEFCVVCDEPHVFENGPMLRPTVCERELCVFAFQTLGVMNEAADEIATGAQKKDYDRVMRALDSLTSIREMTQAPYLEIKKQMDKHDPLAHPLLQWVISSNRSHIVKLPVPRQLKFMHTPHQFLLLSSPPAKESNFRAAKNLFGSTFAFHGSHIENWHSILRNGLVVASNTRLQLHGAIYGNGIYLSPLSSISFGYSGMNKRQQKVISKDEMAASSKTNINLQVASL
uniref:Poly [ADP-ribose] polymerase n=1 Tax=Gadus morhua TaxID=8049 RepID=A0A8C5AXI4_GADMO